MPLPHECSCDFEKQISCTCGYEYKMDLIEQMWKTYSDAEALEIFEKLGIKTGRVPFHPPDINDNWNPALNTEFDRHPVYTAYVWRYFPDTHGKHAWRWVWQPGKGN